MTATQRRRIQAALDEMHSRVWPTIPLRPVYRDALHDFIGEARRQAVEPIFFIAPGFTWLNQLASPSEARLLNLSNETRFPALFDPENFGDSVHLNAHGAAIFSRRLAEQFMASQ
jgi:lysophospholipase L1-like esterase